MNQNNKSLKSRPILSTRLDRNDKSTDKTTRLKDKTYF